MIDVPGATGYLDTNYEGKVQAAIDALGSHDFVLLHVEAPDEAGHSGQMDLKIKAIEDFDQRVVGPILKELEAFENWRILLAPDHQTPESQREFTVQVQSRSCYWILTRGENQPGRNKPSSPKGLPPILELMSPWV